MLLVLASLLACGASDKAPTLTPTDQDEAVADLFTALGTTTRVRVRGRVLEELKASDLPMVQVSQEEIHRAEVEIALLAADGSDVVARSVRADDEGMLDAALDFPAVAPGLHTLVVRYRHREIGRTTARLLEPHHTDPVVRSDVDLTYLLTDFVSKEGMAKLMAQGANERTPLPGMPELYRALQGSSADEFRPLTFLSGSPGFFKQVLEGRMALNGIRPTLLVLKPMKEIVTGGEVPLTGLDSALHDQIGYKLYWLLQLRTEIPSETPEILMGDDSEADFTVYDIYRRLTAGELDLTHLNAELDAVGPPWREAIIDAVPAALASLEGRSPVRAIYIRATGIPSANAPDPNHPPEGLRVHASTWSMALSMQEEGWIEADAVDRIHAELLASGLSEAAMATEVQTAQGAGWLHLTP